MQPSVLEARPPLVNFETRAEEDRNASIAQGSVVYRDVDYAIITPAGSKDRIEREVKDWFANLQDQVRQGRFNEDWFRYYKRSFESWKAEGEIPLEGTSLRNWPVITPAQVKSLLNWNVQTVEQLATANEETLSRLGMGGRSLKDRAVEWLRASGSEAGKQSAEIVNLRQELTATKAQNETLAQELSIMKAQLQALMGRQGAPEPTTFVETSQSGDSFLSNLDLGHDDTPAALKALQNNTPQTRKL